MTATSPPAFRNEPILELRRAPVRESLLEALRELDSRLPLEIPVSVGGDVVANETFSSTDPGNPERIVTVREVGYRLVSV